MRELIPRIIIVCLVCLQFFCKSKDQSTIPQENISESSAKSTATDPIDQKIILKINNTQFTNLDFKRFIQLQYSEIVGNQLNQKLLNRFFDAFVENKLVLVKAEDENIQVDDTEIADYLKKVDVGGMRPDKNAISSSVKVQKYLYNKIYKDINVSEKEIQDYYNKNRDEFHKQDEIVLHQILVKDKDKAIKIRGLLTNDPSNFEEIARTESISLDAEKNGLIGSFQKGELPAEIEAVVFALKVDEISQILQTAYGFHIFRVSQRKKERNLFLSAVKENIRNKLLSDKMDKAYQNLIVQLKIQLKVDIQSQALYFKLSNFKGENNQNEIPKMDSNSLS